MSVHAAVVTLSHPSLGGIGTNTWHIRSTSTGFDTTEFDLQMERIRAFYSNVDPAFATGTVIHFDGEGVGVGADEGEVLSGNTWTITTAGGGDPLPPATCIVVGWRTGSGGRSGRGRTFLGPIGVSVLQDNGTPTEAALTTIRNAAETLVNGSGGPFDGAVGVWSRQDQLLRDFTGSGVRNIFASLRSRRD